MYMDKEEIEKLLLIQKTQQEIVNVLRGNNNSETFSNNRDLYTNYESKIKQGQTVISENLKHLYHKRVSTCEKNENDNKT